VKLDFANVMSHLAVRFADREALVNVERGRRYRFDELHRLTNRIVNMMRGKLGLRRGDVYLCLLENDNLSLLHAWTALKGEASAAWTNFRDSIDEHRWQFDFIRPKVVFIENALLDRYFDLLRERGIRVVCMDPPDAPRQGLAYFWELLEGVGENNPDIASDAFSDPLVYRFTGGTTGMSKCARYTMDNWLASRDSLYVEFDQIYSDETRYLHMAPVSHGSGLAMLPTLFRGGCTITQNQPDLRQWCRNIQAERVTTTLLLPTLVYRLLELPDAAQHDLSSLRTLVYGGSPMSPSKLARAQERFGNVFMQQYGSTECLQAISTLTKADHVQPGERHLASAGRPSPGMDLKIVDENGDDVAPGETGEIWLRSRATISGYFGNPDASATEFEDGYWKSGDLGYIDEKGYLFIVDRKKDMIITGGFNVYAVEVEAALNSHPAVESAAVVGVPHEEWGEAVHAEVVLRAGADVSREALVEHAKARLGRFKAPKSIAFVGSLPLSAVGKVLRRSVRDKYWKGAARRVS
jgi:acyl-CoA synthetase (AMP-forming)/AMP-acid ligase II